MFPTRWDSTVLIRAGNLGGQTPWLGDLSPAAKQRVWEDEGGLGPVIRTLLLSFLICKAGTRMHAVTGLQKGLKA